MLDLFNFENIVHYKLTFSLQMMTQETFVDSVDLD